MSETPHILDRFVDEQGWLQPVEEQVQDGVRGLMSTLGKKVQNFLNGTWLGHPVHPVITDVPIGSWTAAVVLDQMEAATGKRGYGRGADVALQVGVVAAAGAALAGMADWQHLGGRARRVGLMHAGLNTMATVLYLFSIFARKGNRRGTGRALALGGYLISGVSAYLGGDLVYHKKIGVNHAPTERLSPRFVNVLDAGELADSRPTRVHVDGIPVLLVRRGERVYALAERCAHLGGPLADGELRDDNSIVCPWHGSRFDLESGGVLDGPSAYPQPCYEARIRDNRVEIRQVDRYEMEGVER